MKRFVFKIFPNIKSLSFIFISLLLLVSVQKGFSQGHAVISQQKGTVFFSSPTITYCVTGADDILYGYLPSTTDLFTDGTLPTALISGVDNVSDPNTAVISPSTLGVGTYYFLYNNKEYTVNVIDGGPLVLTSPTNGSICSGVAQNYNITSASPGPYIWSRATVTNISPIGISNQTTNPITETLTNRGHSVQTHRTRQHLAYKDLQGGNNCDDNKI